MLTGDHSIVIAPVAQVWIVRSGVSTFGSRVLKGPSGSVGRASFLVRPT
jgi:hypothetical protein